MHPAPGLESARQLLPVPPVGKQCEMQFSRRFKKKLGLRASMKAASFDFLDDWSHASVTLQNLTLHNPDGFSDSIMATIEYIKVGVEM